MSNELKLKDLTLPLLWTALTHAGSGALLRAYLKNFLKKTHNLFLW